MMFMPQTTPFPTRGIFPPQCLAAKKMTGQKMKYQTQILGSLKGFMWHPFSQKVFRDLRTRNISTFLKKQPPYGALEERCRGWFMYGRRLPSGKADSLSTASVYPHQREMACGCNEYSYLFGEEKMWMWERDIFSYL
ncbi:hypothetical protein EBT31_03175 [bacterium]|nr:hypothetical protein [bacterium]